MAAQIKIMVWKWSWKSTIDQSRFYNFQSCRLVHQHRLGEMTDPFSITICSVWSKDHQTAWSGIAMAIQICLENITVFFEMNQNLAFCLYPWFFNHGLHQIEICWSLRSFHQNGKNRRIIKETSFWLNMMKGVYAEFSHMILDKRTIFSIFVTS